jgi:acetyl-CoA carboxylase biotin carboxylase subunit
LRVPGGGYVRDDSGVYQGATISIYYDPLISKLITWGDDRDQALARMRRALDEYVVRGIKTNLIFHRRTLRHAGFCAGEYDTGFVDREPELRRPADAAGEALDVGLIAAAVSEMSEPDLPLGAVSQQNGRSGPSAWRSGGEGWRRR